MTSNGVDDWWDWHNYDCSCEEGHSRRCRSPEGRPSVTLTTCGICHCLVFGDHFEPHAAWHRAMGGLQ